MSFVDYSQAITLVIFYMSVYNLALALFFITLNQVTNSGLTTTFALYQIPQGTSLSKSLLVSFFSMAGIPPFLGFFSKIAIFVIIANLYLFILFPLFFLLLFSGLYFYIQNVRLILTGTDQLSFGNLYVSDLNTRRSTLLDFLACVLNFVLLTGITLLEDFLLYSS